MALGVRGERSMANADTCVIYNPAAGKGRGERRLRRLRRALGAGADFRPTSMSGHAEELAFTAAREGYPQVAAAGGDGTVHEVANGLLRAGKSTILVVYPIGSANDYAHSLGLDADWYRRGDPDIQPRHVDAGIVRSQRGSERFFVNGLGLGFNGAVTMESRRIRGLQGVPLYTLALLRAVCYRFETPLIRSVIDGVERTVPTLALSLALGRREGNFVIAPDARLDDGLFDYVQAGALSRWELLRNLPNMVTGRLPRDHPRIWMGRCRHVVCQSEKPVAVHVDGEMFCTPEDGVRDFEVQLLPGALRVWGRLKN